MESNPTINENSTEVSISETKQLEQFKALYYLIKGKRDTDIKLFDGYKQFRHRDIVELNDKVYRKLQNHQLITNTVNVVVSLSNRELKNFGNWHEFSQFDRNIAPQTNYITIEWDFNLILPNQQHTIPQTHTLRVRIGSALRPNEVIQVIFQGDSETDIEEVQAQVVCKIDFVNAQICNELKTIVTEWYDALQNNSHDHKFIRFILKHKVKLEQSIIVSFLLAGIIFLNMLVKKWTPDFLQNVSEINILNNFYFIITFSIIVIYGFYISGKLYSDRVIAKTVNKFRRNPMFEYTKGDENKLIDVNKNNNKLVKKLILDILLAISVNIITFILGKLIIYFVSIS